MEAEWLGFAEFNVTYRPQQLWDGTGAVPYGGRDSEKGLSRVSYGIYIRILLSLYMRWWAGEFYRTHYPFA